MISTQKTGKVSSALVLQPVNKYVCPVFALSLWLASNKEMTISGGPLFAGSNQELRFSKLSRSFLNEHSELVHACGCDPDLLGVHYIRKGALNLPVLRFNYRFNIRSHPSAGRVVAGKGECHLHII
jgi:hypothetical protein